METAEAQKSAVRKFCAEFKNPRKIAMGDMQKLLSRPRPVRGSMWVSQVTVPEQSERDDDLHAMLWEVFKHRQEPGEILDYPARSVPLQGEWIGARHGVKDPKTPQPEISEKERFAKIEQEQKTGTTMFYLSGGAWVQPGIPGSRPLIAQMCHVNGAKAFTMQYRLAPAHTVPTLLLDAIIGYFYLISPPKHSLHSPIDPSSLILAGESGGASLHLGIIQFIQHFQKDALARGEHSPSVRVNGRQVPLRMPAGCAFVAPPCDLTLALPAFERCKSIDWLSDKPPWFEDDFPADSVWPSNPPRGSPHCDNSALCHPLITISTWTDWEGAPPMWIACGEESYSDGIKCLVRNLVDSNVRTWFCEYEHMPHVFPVLMPFMPQSKDCLKRWAQACENIASGNTPRTSAAFFVRLGDLRTEPRLVLNLLSLSNEEVLDKMRAARDRMADFVWKGPVRKQSRI